MKAREFLSQRAIAYGNRLVDETPVDRTATLDLARRAKRLLVKAGDEILRFDTRERPLTESDVLRWLVHEDGFLRVPVLVIDDLLVRGYTDELYREALGG